MNWTAEDLRAHYERLKFPQPDGPSAPKPKRKPSHTRGQMNKVEALYAEELELRRIVGDVKWWHFEAITFRLAEKTTYTPDFVICLGGGEIEAVEVKGCDARGNLRWEDDGRAKYKIAREMFPWLCWRCFGWLRTGGWKEGA